MTAFDLRPTIRAAGGILRRDGSRTEYLVVHRPRYDDWSFPKGKLDPGESYLPAAHREVLEETGYRGTDPLPVGSIGYDTLAGKAKLVRWWSMTAGSGEFHANPEVDDIEWLTGAEARERLSYRNDRNVLDRAVRLAADASAATVHVICHAAAGEAAPDGHPDGERPLDATGRAQAVALALELRRSPLTRIISGAGAACRETVSPLAESLDISPEVDSRLNVDAGVDDFLTLLGDVRGDAVAVSSHADTIGAVLRALNGRGVELSDPLERPTGSVWTLQLRNGQEVSAVFSPPPPLPG